MPQDSLSTIAEIIRTHGANRPEIPALEIGGRSVTYGELDARSSQVAQALQAAGVGRDDRVAFVGKNSIEWFEVAFGLAKLGAVNVTVNWRLAPAEMLHIVNDARAVLLIISDEFVEHLEKIESELHDVATIVTTCLHDRWLRYEAWVEEQPIEDPGVQAAGEDVAFQFYTSGTTGLPKGVMITNDNFFHHVIEIADRYRLTTDAVNLVTLPMFHVGGLRSTLMAMLVGCRTVVMREADPAEILRIIPKYGVTVANMVPAVIQFVLGVPAANHTDFSSLRTVIYASAPITDSVLVAGLEAFACEFIQGYGLTETTALITELAGPEHDPRNRPHLLRSCGKPYPWVEIRIVDPSTGEDMPQGEVGELWTRSGHNMKGYWNNPTATAQTVTADGWLKTGDAGYVDADGFVFLHDRMKDMIVTGGENVYPAEVENILMNHPGVGEVAVIGVPDERWGEAVKAVVVKAPGADLTEAGLIAFARESLAGYKLPKSVDYVDTLPRNPMGKVLKRKLREHYWAGVHRRIG